MSGSSEEYTPNELRLAALSFWATSFIAFYVLIYQSAINGGTASITALIVSAIMTMMIFRGWGKNKDRPFFNFMDLLIGLQRMSNPPREAPAESDFPSTTLGNVWNPILSTMKQNKEISKLEPHFKDAKHSIFIRVEGESQAYFLSIIKMSKLIMGEPGRLNITIKNNGTESFPEEPLIVIMRIRWNTDQEFSMPYPISKNALKPDECTSINIPFTCLSEGACLVYCRFEFTKPVHRFVATIPLAVVNLSPSTIGKTDEGEFWNHVTTTTIKSLWVCRWQELYSFWALILSSIAALIAAIGLILK